MATASPSTLIDAIRTSGLLDDGELERVVQFQADAPDVKTLATRIVRGNLLTLYQVQQLLKGRAKHLILGNYLLMERIGEGGMGQVFKARHRKLNRLAAVKIIRPDLLAQPNVLARFQREARAAAQLGHPNIVAIYDADQDGDTHYLAMEYVAGTDLARMLADRGPLPPAEACEFMRQTALGLQHAHSRGLVHRDIKPHNLLVTKDSAAEGSIQCGLAGVYGVVKILDMGLARALAPDARELGAITHEGVVVGTLDYLAPEQARDTRAADHRSDLYSLGCTFYHLLTGKPPFVEGDGVGKLLKHQMDTPPPVEAVRSDVPPAMLAVLYRLMAKKPEDRYQTAGEAANALAACLSDAPLAGTPKFTAVAVHNAPTTALDPGSTPREPMPTQITSPPIAVLPRTRWFASSRWRWLAIGGFSLIVLLLIVALGKQKEKDNADELTRADPLLDRLHARTAGVLRIDVKGIEENAWVKKHFGAALAKFVRPPPFDQVSRVAVLIGADEAAGDVVLAEIPREIENLIRTELTSEKEPDERGGDYSLYLAVNPKERSPNYIALFGDHIAAISQRKEPLFEMLGKKADPVTPAARLDELKTLIGRRDPDEVAWFAIHRDVLARFDAQPLDEDVKKDLAVLRREVQLFHGGVTLGDDIRVRLVFRARTDEGVEALAEIINKYHDLGRTFARWLPAKPEFGPALSLVPLLKVGKVTVSGRDVVFTAQMSAEKLDREVEKLRQK